MPRYLTAQTVQAALQTMPGTVAPMFYFWLVLKRTGLRPGTGVANKGGQDSPFIPTHSVMVNPSHQG